MSKNILVFENIVFEYLINKNVIEMNKCFQEFCDDAENFVGTENAFYNFAINYAKIDDYPSACKILEIALNKHPESMYLRALYLRIGVEAGKKEREQCKEILNQINEYPKQHWSKQMFTYVIEYFRLLIESGIDEETRKKYIFEKDKLIDEFCNHYPKNESSYLIKSDKYKRHSDLENEICLLIKSIENTEVCIWSAIRLSEIFYTQRKFQDAITLINKYCKYCAIMEEERNHEAYSYYLSAMCKSALLLDNSENVEDENIQKEKAKKIYKEFDIALKLKTGLPAYAKNNAIKQISMIEVLTDTTSGLNIE